MNLRVMATLLAAVVITLAVAPGHAEPVLHLAAEHEAVDRFWHAIRHLAHAAARHAAARS